MWCSPLVLFAVSAVKCSPFMLFTLSAVHPSDSDVGCETTIELLMIWSEPTTSLKYQTWCLVDVVFFLLGGIVGYKKWLPVYKVANVLFSDCSLSSTKSVETLGNYHFVIYARQRCSEDTGKEMQNSFIVQRQVFDVHCSLLAIVVLHKLHWLPVSSRIEFMNEWTDTSLWYSTATEECVSNDFFRHSLDDSPASYLT